MNYKVKENFNVKFVFDSNLKSSKFSCDVCDHILTTQDDIKCGEEFGSCYQCHLRIIQPNIAKWKEGWRPSKITEERVLPELSFQEGDN